MRILVIEDEVRLREQIRAKLILEGYVADAAADGHQGFFMAQEYPQDLLIVDLGLPGMSGLDIVRQLRASGKTTPILILTARGLWQDKVAGLEAGADDYLTKPFQMEELLARIKALIRRSAGAVHNILEAGPIKVDLSAQKVWLAGDSVELTTFEYRLLEFLVKARGSVIPKSQLSDYLYPHDEDRDSNVLEVLVGRLRRKLDPGGDLHPVETLRGRGYRFTLFD